METQTEFNNNGYHDPEFEEYYNNLRGNTPIISSMGREQSNSLLKFLITMPEEWKEYQILAIAKYQDPEEAYLTSNVMYAFKRAHYPLDWIIMQLAASLGARERPEELLQAVSSFRYITNTPNQKEKNKSGDSKLGPLNG